MFRKPTPGPFLWTGERKGDAISGTLKTDEFLLSLGVAGSLDIAIRQATSDMARWLESDFKLTGPESAVVLGFANIYDIPDMVPPYLGVTSRIPKKALKKP
jgi:amidase